MICALKRVLRRWFVRLWIEANSARKVVSNMDNTVFDLRDFDKYCEDNRREVKKARGGLPISLWESYSALCNTYGGVIICGIQEREDGSWYPAGLKASDVSKLKRDFWNAINKKKVSVNLLKQSELMIHRSINQ